MVCLEGHALDRTAKPVLCHCECLWIQCDCKAASVGMHDRHTLITPVFRKLHLLVKLDHDLVVCLPKG